MSKRGELADEIWLQAGKFRRLAGRAKFDSLFEQAIEEAPVHQIWAQREMHKSMDAKAAIARCWESDVRKHQNVTFGPLAWIIVGSLINFIITKLLEWAFESHANSVLVAGWNAEIRSNRTARP